MANRLLNSKIVKFVFLLMADFVKTDFQGICAQMAFYILMAFFPLLLFLISFVGEFVIEFETYLDQILMAFLPDLSYAYVTDLLASMTSQISDSNYFLILITFYFAALAARAIMIGLNQTYGRVETRSYLRIWLLSFLFTLFFGLAILLIAIAYVFSLEIGEFIFQFFGLSLDNYPVWRLLALIVSLILSTLLFNIVYIMATTKREKFLDGLPGALFATLGINFAFRLLALFINNSNNYSILYGNLGGLFALLVGIYSICVVLNLGGKINLYWFLYKNR